SQAARYACRPDRILGFRGRCCFRGSGYRPLRRRLRSYREERNLLRRRVGSHHPHLFSAPTVGCAERRLFRGDWRTPSRSRLRDGLLLLPSWANSQASAQPCLKNPKIAERQSHDHFTSMDRRVVGRISWGDAWRNTTSATRRPWRSLTVSGDLAAGVSRTRRCAVCAVAALLPVS